jgi:tetratricopeptide (TPR) repeat protein
LDFHIYPLKNRTNNTSSTAVITNQSIGNTLHAIGWQYEVQGEYEQALKHYDESIAMKRKSVLLVKNKQIDNGVKASIDSNLAHTLFNLGVVNDKLDKSKESMRAFEEACALHKKANEPEGMLKIGETLNSMGTLYFKQSKFTEALECFQESLAYFGKGGIDERHASFKKTLNNIAIVKIELTENGAGASGENGKNNEANVTFSTRATPFFFYK